MLGRVAVLACFRLALRHMLSRTTLVWLLWLCAVLVLHLNPPPPPALHAPAPVPPLTPVVSPPAPLGTSPKPPIPAPTPEPVSKRAATQLRPSEHYLQDIENAELIAFENPALALKLLRSAISSEERDARIYQAAAIQCATDYTRYVHPASWI